MDEARHGALLRLRWSRGGRELISCLGCEIWGWISSGARRGWRAGEGWGVSSRDESAGRGRRLAAGGVSVGALGCTPGSVALQMDKPRRLS